MLTMFARATSSTQSGRYLDVPRSNPAAGHRNRGLLVEAVAETDRVFVEDKLNELYADTLHVSSISVIIRHPAFQELTARKDACLRRLLEKLNEGDVRYHWFPLLKRCAGFDPVPAEDRGFTQKMTEHWVRWGKEGGKI